MNKSHIMRKYMKPMFEYFKLQKVIDLNSKFVFSLFI